MDLFDMDEVEELVEKLTKWSVGYYGGNPLVSDQVYDAAEMRLRDLDPTNNYFNTVGADIKESTFEKVVHDILMLSLNKAYSIEEVVNWVSGNKLHDRVAIAMPKMDGFALSLKYKLIDGFYIFTQAVTRGKGEKGDDVTENARQIEDIPKKIKPVDTATLVPVFEVRGEVYIKKSIFEEINANKEFENCRNIAPASIQTKDPLVTKHRKLSFFAYNIYGIKCLSMLDKFWTLSSMGFEVVHAITVELSDEMDIKNAFFYYETEKENFDYFIDGVVIMANDMNIYDSLGNTAHHPRGAIAWKFEAEEGETTFIEYQWQVSRTGLVNPVGIYEGIRIDGATLTNATMHNLSIVKDLNVGVGDKIIVSRRGGVIPKIERVTERKGIAIDIPTHCPVCGSLLEIHTSEEGIETLHCVSLDCSAQILTRILYFVSIMEIMDVGESIIAQMIDNGFINTSADLFKVTKDNLLTLEGVKDKKADRTLNSINLARKKTLGVFLASLGIKGLGVNISKTVANHFESLYRILSAAAKEFEAIPGIADITANNIYDGLKSNSELIGLLCKEVEVVGMVPKVIGGRLGGKSFLVTGTLSQPRSYFEKLIEENGGVLKSSVSKTLDYLIVGDDAGSKLDKAKKAGVKTIFEDEFMWMLKE